MRSTVRRKLTIFGALAGTAGLLLMGGSALASSGHSTISRGKITSGPEVISGTIHGKAVNRPGPVIPLRLTGLVTAVGSVNLGGPNTRNHHLSSTAGRLNVRATARPQQRQTENPANCRISFTQTIPLKVTGGTATFAGASGPGAVQVFFAGFVPRFKSGPRKGQCNPNARVFNQGAVASFLFTAALTVK